MKNQQVYNELSNLVANKFFQKSEKLHFGDLEINDFSICFKVQAAETSHRYGVYVKIPKFNLYSTGKNHIMPLNDLDRSIAEEEFKSLTYLSKRWNTKDLTVRFVNPRDFFSDYNAIITDIANGEDLFAKLKNWDLKQRIKNNNVDNPINTILTRLAISLSKFHRTPQKKEIFNAEKIVRKIKRFCSQLEKFKVNINFLDQILQKTGTVRNFVYPTRFAVSFLICFL